MEWENEVTRLLAGTAEEQAKFYLHDPSNNVIEVKTYRRPEHTLMLHVSNDGAA